MNKSGCPGPSHTAKGEIFIVEVYIEAKNDMIKGKIDTRAA